MIYDNVELMLRRMKEQLDRDGYTEMRVNYLAFATDTATGHCFGEPTGLLQDEEKAVGWHHTILSLARNMPLARQFSWVVPLSLRLPLRPLEILAPNLARIVKLHLVSRIPFLYMNDID